MSLIHAWRERRTRSCLDELGVETLRFRELLQDARSLFDLFADGEEKSRGDYIIDMHYVTSLADQAIERAGRLVFDACMLAAGAEGVLFPLLDEQKRTAEAFHRASRDRRPRRPADNGASGPLEPEYQLLRQVLDWFRRAPPIRGGGRPLTNLLQAGLDYGVAAPRRPAIPESCLGSLLLASHEVRVVRQEREAGPARESTVTLAELDCRPLGLLVEGRQAEAGEGAQERQTGNWLAVVREDDLSLRAGGGGAEHALRVEALASGHVESDFIFLYAGRRQDLYRKMPLGLEIEETPQGRLGWAYDVPKRELEQTLNRVGQAIFE
jgi:hypothetical protein